MFATDVLFIDQRVLLLTQTEQAKQIKKRNERKEKKWRNVNRKNKKKMKIKKRTTSEQLIILFLSAQLDCKGERTETEIYCVFEIMPGATIYAIREHKLSAESNVCKNNGIKMKTEYIGIGRNV